MRHHGCTDALGLPERQPAPRPASQPLSGLIVVELGHSVAAPFAGSVFADLGATVLKIENPKGGDDTRSWGPPFWEGTALTFHTFNRNKRFLALDLRHAKGKAIFAKLVARADVVLDMVGADWHDVAQDRDLWRLVVDGALAEWGSRRVRACAGRCSPGRPGNPVLRNTRKTEPVRAARFRVFLTLLAARHVPFALLRNTRKEDHTRTAE